MKSELLELAELGFSESLIRICSEHFSLSTEECTEVLQVAARVRRELASSYRLLPPPEEEAFLLVLGAYNPEVVRCSLSRLNWTLEEGEQVMELREAIRKTRTGEHLPVCILSKQLLTSSNPTMSWWADFFLTLYSVELTEVETRVLDNSGGIGNPQVEN